MASPTIDLLALIGASTKLSYVTATNGGEYCGKCPLPGCSSQHDALRVQPNANGPSNGLWWCRKCSPDSRWHGPVEWLIRLEGIALAEAKQRLGLSPAPAATKQTENPQTYPDRHGCTWADYTTWGAKLESFADYGGGSTRGQVFDSIFFSDSTGGRYRLFGHPKSKFMPAHAGQQPCFYGLPEAVALAKASGQDALYLVNGQPSVITCHTHGVPAFTVPGGESGIAGHIEKTLLRELMGQWAGKLRIVLDGDATGYKAATRVVDVLTKAGYIDVMALEPGKGNDAADLCVLNNGTSVQAFQSLPLYYPLPPPPPPPAPPHTPGAAPTPPPLPRFDIDVTRQDVGLLIQPTWDAVIAHNQPATLFRRDMMLAQIRETDGKAILHPVTLAGLRAIVMDACVYVEDKSNGKKPWLKPDIAILETMREKIDLRIEPVDRLVHVPVFDPAGNLLDTPGYHPSARLYYHPRPGLTIPDVPATPTQDEMLAARLLLLDDVLGEFPFVGNADRAHAVALMLLPYVRDMIPGPTPLHLIEAPTPASGKNLLADVTMLPALGQKPTPQTEAREDDEWRKKLTAALIGAPEVMLLDNINSALESGSLASIVANTTWQDRLLGSSTQLNMPVRCIWIVTANNVFMSKEIARRSVRIRLDPKCENPQQRSGWKHDPLFSWVREHQSELVAACLTLIRYGLQHGKKTPTTLGTFDEWATVIGQILDGIGIPDFLGNVQDLYDQADSESKAWHAITEDWWATYDSTPVGISSIFTLIDQDTDLPIRGKDETSRKISFGKLLKGKKDRVFGAYQIVDAGTVSRAQQWRLVEIAQSTSQTTPAAPQAAPAPTPVKSYTAPPTTPTGAHSASQAMPQNGVEVYPFDVPDEE